MFGGDSGMTGNVKVFQPGAILKEIRGNVNLIQGQRIWHIPRVLQ
jgi:hypothetical protein